MYWLLMYTWKVSLNISRARKDDYLWHMSGDVRARRLKQNGTNPSSKYTHTSRSDLFTLTGCYFNEKVWCWRVVIGWIELTSFFVLLLFQGTFTTIQVGGQKLWHKHAVIRPDGVVWISLWFHSSPLFWILVFSRDTIVDLRHNNCLALREN